MKKILPSLCLMLTLTLPSAALAQDEPNMGVGGAVGLLTLVGVLSTVIYGVIGIALCILGYFAFDKLAGLDLKRELVEDQNIALGIMLAGVFIGIAIVVAAAII